jgi:hypothetical protein
VALRALSSNLNVAPNVGLFVIQSFSSLGLNVNLQELLPALPLTRSLRLRLLIPCWHR